MRLDVWAAVFTPVYDFARSSELKPFWLALLKAPPEDMPQEDRAVLAVLALMPDGGALELLGALKRWALDLGLNRGADVATLTVGVVQLEQRVRALSGTPGHRDDCRALRRLLTRLQGYQAPPMLMEALKALLTNKTNPEVW